MSERQAKLNRKTSVPKEVKKNPKGTIINVVVVLLVVAVAALGVYAVWDIVAENLAADNTEQTQQAQTVADAALQEGVTVEELLAKFGLEESGLTAESSISDLNGIITIENYAKYMGITVDELKAQNGIESLPNDTLWQDAQLKVPMSKIAEQSGVSFDEFKETNGLPEGITADTTYEDAIKIIQTQTQTEE